MVPGGPWFSTQLYENAFRKLSKKLTIAFLDSRGSGSLNELKSWYGEIRDLQETLNDHRCVIWSHGFGVISAMEFLAQGGSAEGFIFSHPLILEDLKVFHPEEDFFSQSFESSIRLKSMALQSWTPARFGDFLDSVQGHFDSGSKSGPLSQLSLLAQQSKPVLFVSSVGDGVSRARVKLWNEFLGLREGASGACAWADLKKSGHFAFLEEEGTYLDELNKWLFKHQFIQKFVKTG